MTDPRGREIEFWSLLDLKVSHMTESLKVAADDDTNLAHDVLYVLSSAVTSVSSVMLERLESSRSSHRFFRNDWLAGTELGLGTSLASVLDILAEALPSLLAFWVCSSTALLLLLSISTAESSAAIPEEIFDASTVVMVQRSMDDSIMRAPGLFYEYSTLLLVK